MQFARRLCAHTKSVQSYEIFLEFANFFQRKNCIETPNSKIPHFFAEKFANVRIFLYLCNRNLLQKHSCSAHNPLQEHSCSAHNPLQEHSCSAHNPLPKRSRRAQNSPPSRSRSASATHPYCLDPASRFFRDRANKKRGDYGVITLLLPRH